MRTSRPLNGRTLGRFLASEKMSTLTHVEKRRLERLLNMAGGYVLDFTNRTFEEFVRDVVRKEIYDDKYDYASGSKANRLRAFWDREPDNVVARLLDGLIDYARDLGAEPGILQGAREIVDRLLQGAQVPDIDAIAPNAEGRDFEALAEAVRSSIEADQPEVGLDRLHTFTVKYIAVLCERRGIQSSKTKPLHSLFGELLKALKAEGAIESVMGERILKSTISILEAFNDVRNNRSLAHDNQLLSYDEALLILNHVSSAIRFLAAIESTAAAAPEPSATDDDVPF